MGMKHDLVRRLALLLLTTISVACKATSESAPAATSAAQPSAEVATATTSPTIAAAATATEKPTLEPTADPIRVFRVVPDSSEAIYRVEEEFFNGTVDRLGKELGLFEAVGRTQEIDGEIRLNLVESGSVEIVSGEFTVNIRSLTSDDRRRDQRIREEYLESDQFPTAVFEMTGVEDFPVSINEGEEIAFVLVGELTIREIANEVRFETTATLAGDTITGVATTTIQMVDFGFDPPEIVGFMKALDPATIQIQLTLEEDKGPFEETE